MGNIFLKVTELGYSFPFPKRARSFKCTKNLSGILEFKADLVDTQTNRNEYTTHLVGDPFSQSKVAREEFIRNKEELIGYL